MAVYPSYNWTGAPADFDALTTDPILGGDPRTENVNKWFAAGDQAYVLVAAAMVMLMIPGLGFLYAGLARRKSALAMMAVCAGALAVVSLQWYLWGYSLAFAPSASSGFIGNLSNAGLRHTLAAPSVGSPLIPDLLFAFYQMQFCAVTAAIMMGAVAERGRLVPAMVFVFVWATLVYCPVAYWAWHPQGWAFQFGVLDYAGGGPVEVVSGGSALAYAWVLGPRRDDDDGDSRQDEEEEQGEDKEKKKAKGQRPVLVNYRPHNVSLVLLGTALLWFGWLGFNGAAAYGANLRAVVACWNSFLCASSASLTWVALDARRVRRWSVVGWCSGAISGLVAITPSAGFLPPWAALILGLVTGVVANYSTKIKYLLRIDDAMDVLAEHGIPGMVGLLFNALFADDAIAGLDGVNTGNADMGGWLVHNYRQLYIQLAYLLACAGYSFVVSAVFAYAINSVPGLHLRASRQAELLGMDDDQLGEFAYDYVEVRRDYLAWHSFPPGEQLGPPPPPPSLPPTLVKETESGQIPPENKNPENENDQIHEAGTPGSSG